MPESRVKRVFDYIKRLLGIHKYSEFVNEFFHTANVRASIYMSVVVIVLEARMMQTLTQYVVRKYREGEPKSLEWCIRKYSLYGILFTLGVLMLIYAIRYLKAKKRPSWVLGKVLMVVFSTACILFGIYVSYGNYADGEQILCFLTMVIFAMCLFVWRPWISIIAISASFLVFYRLMLSCEGVEMTYATQFNFFTLWVSVVLVSVSCYQQRYLEAMSQEELEKNNAYLRDISIHDKVTGIHNLNYFMKTAREITFDGSKTKPGYKYLFIDIENFKAYNETRGFEKGNELLRDFAQNLKRIFEGELTGRFSDDHFIAVTQKENIKPELAELQEFLSDSADDIKLSVKCGAYTTTTRPIDPSLALDHARYAAGTLKKKPDLHYCEYDTEMSDDIHMKQYVVGHIDEAVEKRWIQVYFQPVIDAATGKLCGAEALARWKDPKMGLLPPFKFVPALEEYRLIYKLDAFIAEDVFRTISENLKAGRQIVPVSVNFSRIDFEFIDITEFIDELYETYQIPRDMIHVEITESALDSGTGLVHRALLNLKEHGHAIWLDDFGSGYSSLNVLKDYEFDVLKIDMVFLRNFENNPKSRIILGQILSMAKSLGIDTLCEGVETEEHVKFLKDNGCKMLQGYFYGKPMPREEFEKLL